MSQEQREVGIVKFYNPRKGYGFVTRPDGSDVFFHLTHFRTATKPAPGSVVRFTLGQNREGLTAEDIVVVSSDEVERYAGAITQLDDEGGVITTPDEFEITFRRSDFIPHTRADSLEEGDQVEMNFLVEENGGWRATVVRDPDFQPDTSPTPADWGSDDEENRRLLGILYKTDLDDEAIQAARLLTERNMRATLSALVSRVFDLRLSREVRRELVELIPKVYFDDECQDYLDDMAQRLDRTLREEDSEQNPWGCRALELLLDDQRFPMRWSQYFIPFALTLLRNLSTIPSCHSTLEQDDSAEPAHRLFERVARHIEQRRSGYGYVMTTALSTFDELWQRHVLLAPIREALPRLLGAVDEEGLGNQLHHLRDKLSAPFLEAFLPVLSEHEALPAVAAVPAQGEVYAQWIETLWRQHGDRLPTDGMAALLPLIEELHQRNDAETPARLLAPIGGELGSEQLLPLLHDESTPQRVVWAALRLLDRRGELHGLLAKPQVRDLVTDFLQRSSASEGAMPREQEISTALRLIDSLRANDDLRGELVGIGRSLFQGVHERIRNANSRELVALLDRLDLNEMPGLTAALLQRITDDSLEEAAQQRVLAYFVDLGAPLADVAAALVGWRRRPADPHAVNALIAQLEAHAASDDGELSSCLDVLREALAQEAIGWYDGLLEHIEETPDGRRAALLQGYAIRLPERLFDDRLDFAPNRFVRFVHRRGVALGVLRAAEPEGSAAVGRLAEPLAIDDRDAIVGTLVDAQGHRSHFEMANLVSGFDQPLRQGSIFKYARVPSPLSDASGRQADYIAFRIDSHFEPSDLPLLLETTATAADEAVALAAMRLALALSTDHNADVWREHWAHADPARRDVLQEALDESARRQLLNLLDV